MRIVHIEDFFHADAGYQVNILSKYFVQEGHEVTIVTAEMDKIPDELTAFFGRDNVESSDRAYEEAYGVKIIRVPVVRYFSGRVIYDKSIFSIVEGLKPDVLYVHGNDTLIGMQYTWKAKRLSYPIVTDSHMLEMASTNKLSKYFRAFYRRFVAPCIIKGGIPVIRTQDDPYVERFLGIPLSMCPWISYGSDVLLFHPDEQIKADFRKKHGIAEDAFVAVFAGKLIESKGAMLLAEAFREKFDGDRQVVLVAVGNTSGEYGRKVEDTFACSENLILRFPTQKYNDLAQYYQAADIAVFARQCSLSFYDVQACGLPVISEDNNINADRCSHGNGMCFQCGSLTDFRAKIQAFLDMDEQAFGTYCTKSKAFILSEYDYGQKAREYLAVIQASYDRFHNSAEK